MSDKIEAEFDVRTMEHKVRRGEITREALRARLAELPDDAARGQDCVTRFTNNFASRGDEAPEG
ncbi:MAG: hypothetical protein ACI9K2_005684, partial [Myxococcota bacterium]